MTTKTNKAGSKKDSKDEKGVTKYSEKNAALTFEGDFDALYNLDEKEVSKQMMYKQNRDGKKLQLLAKCNDISMRMIKAEGRYKKSLLDPTQDSVDALISIKVLKEEMTIAKDLTIKLFPETAVSLSAL